MGERVLGFAYREMAELPLDYPFTNKPEPNFEFKVGLLRAPSAGQRRQCRQLPAESTGTR